MSNPFEIENFEQYLNTVRKELPEARIYFRGQTKLNHQGFPLKPSIGRYDYLSKLGLFEREKLEREVLGVFSNHLLTYVHHLPRNDWEALDGVQAVQTLSRLNRKISGKDDPFVLDFVNQPDDIYAAFKPYYDTTGLQQESDPAKLETLKHELDQAQVYHWSEVEAFARIFYRPIGLQNAADHAHMQRHLQPAVDRFKAIPESEKRAEFRDKLAGYVGLYAFLSQIVPYPDPELEMLYSYGRYLLPHLPLDRDNTVLKLGDEVALAYYRLERVYSGGIELKEGEAEGVKSPTEVGTGKAKDEKVPLSKIIQVLNERFGTNLSEEDRLFFEQIKERAVKNEQVINTALANPVDKFQLGVRKLVEELMIQRMADNDKIVTRYMDDQKFQDAAYPILAKEIFDAIKAREGVPPG